MSNSKPKCFVYLRRSQDREDRQQLSIEKQDRVTRQLVTKHDLMPIFLPPEDRSAKYLGRPIFNDMMDKIEAGEARYIAVWIVSRLSRNPVDGGRILHALDTGKLLAIYTPGRIFRNTTDDKMFLAIEFALAKRNNDDLSDQVKDSFVEKRKHGEYPGPAPLGYVNAIIGPGRRNIVPDEDVAPKVIRLFEMAASGLYTLQTLWLEAQKMHLLSRRGQTLSKQTIAELLKRRMYNGVFRYGGEEWHQGSYTPLIRVETFDKVQMAMGWARKSVTRPATTSGRYYPYKGLLLCETCEFNITAYTKSKQLKNGLVQDYVFYTCTKKNREIKCAEPQLSSTHLEVEIKTRMQEFEISEQDGKVCNNWLQKHYEAYVLKRDTYKPELIAEQKRAQKALDVLDEKLETGIISDERYKARAAKHQESLARTEQLLGQSASDAERWLELAKETFSSVVNIGDVFEEANNDERRQLMMYLGLNWHLGNKKVALTPREPLSLLRHSSENPNWRARPDSNRRSPP